MKAKVRYFILLAAVLAALFQTGCTRKERTADGIRMDEDRIVTAFYGEADEAEGTDAVRETDAVPGTDEDRELEGSGEKGSQTDHDGAVLEAADMMTDQAEAGPAYVYVHICGEVEKPGVYRVPHDGRIYQVISLAGGLLPTAAEDAVNQAAVVEDGMKIRIPSVQEAEEASKEEGKEFQTQSSWVEYAGTKSQTGNGTDTGQSGTGDKRADGRVNINTASESELCTLNGIGESRAKSIIQYRSEHGGFQKIEDIMKVEGIKDGAFAKIKDSIVVE